jgi:hypothetical protein
MLLKRFAAGPLLDEGEAAGMIEIEKQVVPDASFFLPRGGDETFEHFAQLGFLTGFRVQMGDDIDFHVGRFLGVYAGWYWRERNFQTLSRNGPDMQAKERGFRSSSRFGWRQVRNWPFPTLFQSRHRMGAAQFLVSSKVPMWASASFAFSAKSQEKAK